MANKDFVTLFLAQQPGPGWFMFRMRRLPPDGGGPLLEPVRSTVFRVTVAELPDAFPKDTGPWESAIRSGFMSAISRCAPATERRFEVLEVNGKVDTLDPAPFAIAAVAAVEAFHEVYRWEIDGWRVDREDDGGSAKRDAPVRRVDFDCALDRQPLELFYTLVRRIPEIDWWQKDSYWSNKVLARTRDGYRISVDPDETPCRLTIEFESPAVGLPSYEDLSRAMERLGEKILAALGAVNVREVPSKQTRQSSEADE